MSEYKTKAEGGGLIRGLKAEVGGMRDKGCSTKSYSDDN